MKSWSSPWTDAANGADTGMTVVAGLMSFASATRGQPTREQRSLYVAAVAFTYAVWENYVEDLAVELTEMLAAELEAGSVPPSARSAIEHGASAWQLSVHPGWRGLWVDRTRVLAKGDEATATWGLNTANYQNVNRLYKTVGIDAVPARLPAPPPRGQKKIMPKSIAIAKDGTLDVGHALGRLIAVRGEAVHTAKTSEPLLKDEVLWWGDFVANLYHATDRQATAACKALFT